MLKLFTSHLLITNKNLIISLLIHFTLLIITFYYFERKKNLYTKHYNTLEVEVIITPRPAVKKTESSQKATEQINKNNGNEKNYKSKSFYKKDEVEKKIDNKKVSKGTFSTTNKLQNENEIKKKKLENTDKKNYKNLVEKTNTENIKQTKKHSKENKSSTNNDAELKNYKDYLKKKIQTEAAINYPRVSKRKGEEGKVEIMFSLNDEGEIKEINIGKKTTASLRLKESLINVLKNKIVKFKKNEILKKTNSFSIIIVYKLK